MRRNTRHVSEVRSAGVLRECVGRLHDALREPTEHAVGRTASGDLYGAILEFTRYLPMTPGECIEVRERVHPSDFGEQVDGEPERLAVAFVVAGVGLRSGSRRVAECRQPGGELL